MKKKRKLAPGGGRKPEGRERVHLNMRPEAIAKLDVDRGELTRGRHVERLLGFSNDSALATGDGGR